MKWFKKLFQGKCEKLTEKCNINKKAWFDKFKPSNSAVSADEGCPVGHDTLQALDVFVPVSSEVYALTTIKNFRSDTLDTFSCDSDWVIVSCEQFYEPKFQQSLRNTDSLTDMCRSLAETSINKRKAEVVARPPNCHCDELSSDSCESEKPSDLNFLTKVINSFRRFWRFIYSKLKCRKKSKAGNIPDTSKSKRSLMDSKLSTYTYLCRYRLIRFKVSSVVISVLYFK